MVAAPDIINRGKRVTYLAATTIVDPSGHVVRGIILMVTLEVKI